MIVEILERATHKTVVSYPVNNAGEKEPPTPEACVAIAWGKAVADGHVDEQCKSDYEILIGQEFGYTPETDVWPMTLLEGARSAAAVADAAVCGFGPINPSHPTYLTVLFLLGQAIETALKAFLCLRGFSEKQLKNADHNLPEILRLAVKFGFPEPHSIDSPLLELLNTTYWRQRKLQYHRASGINTPFLRPIRELAHEYITRALPTVRRSGYDCEPGSYGLFIHAKADYGSPSLSEFRAKASAADLSSLAGKIAGGG